MTGSARFRYGMVMTMFLAVFCAPSQEPAAGLEPLHVTVDLNVGETREVTLTDGRTVSVVVSAVDEVRDTIIGAVRQVGVRVSVDGQEAVILSGNYNLPATVGPAQVDCPITQGYYRDTGQDSWALERDVRLRLWPAGSAWIAPGTFRYPVKQRWFASGTQMSNEPTYVDAGEYPRTTVYYHNGLDIGGAEGLTEITAATDGLVIVVGEDILPGHEETPAQTRYDVVYILDDRGWYYRYSHLVSIVSDLRPGVRVRMGDPIGILGKEGGSGGWSHLHFQINNRQPSGRWGTEEGYAFLWQSYVAEHQPSVIAVARPHHFAAVGETVTLDARKSMSFAGAMTLYEWEFSDGTTAVGPVQERVYQRPGQYSEILKVTNNAGAVGYDFTLALVVDTSLPPAQQAGATVHGSYHPSQNIRAGDAVTFLARVFNAQSGTAVWDFGDGSPPVTVESAPVTNPRFLKHAGWPESARGDTHDTAGYPTTVHRFAEPGAYVVRVSHAGEYGYTVEAHVFVSVGE